MKRWAAILIATALVFALALAIACQDIEKGDVPPPGVNVPGSGSGGWNCDISNEGLTAVPFAVACQDPTGGDNGMGLSDVLGQGEVLINGSRLELRGAYNFADFGEGKIEASIGCSSYHKCSFPFEGKKGDFLLRVDASGCPNISKPQEVTLNVYDAKTDASYAFCTVFLGEAATTDDDDDGQTWDCSIPADDLLPIPFHANCYEPLGDGGALQIGAVLGSSPTLTDGARFAVTGHHAFVGVSNGRLEPVVGCPLGSTYPKCSWPFETAIGDFEMRLQIGDCTPLPAEQVIVINRRDEATGQTITVCEIFLGDAATDDDTTP